jgi:hypothetical protein
MASLQHPERMRTRAARSCYGEPKSCTEAPRSPRLPFPAAKGRRFRRGCGARSSMQRRTIRAPILTRVFKDRRPDPAGVPWCARLARAAQRLLTWTIVAFRAQGRLCHLSAIN